MNANRKRFLLELDIFWQETETKLQSRLLQKTRKRKRKKKKRVAGEEWYLGEDEDLRLDPKRARELLR